MSELDVREEPIPRLRLEDLRRLAWEPWRTQTIVNWCGHSQEYVPWPEARGWWPLVPVWDLGDRAGGNEPAALEAAFSVGRGEPWLTFAL